MEQAAAHQLETTCQQCDRPVVLSEADRVTLQHQQHVESLCSTGAASQLRVHTVHGRKTLGISPPSSGIARGAMLTHHMQSPVHSSKSLTYHTCLPAAQPTPLSGSYVDVREAVKQPRREPKRSSSLHDLGRVLELATTETHFDHPLCAKCLDAVGKELQERLSEAEQLARAYEHALAELQVCSCHMAQFGWFAHACAPCAHIC